MKRWVCGVCVVVAHSTKNLVLVINLISSILVLFCIVSESVYCFVLDTSRGSLFLKTCFIDRIRRGI